MPVAAHCWQNLRLMAYRNCNWMHESVIIISLQAADDNTGCILPRQTIFMSFLIDFFCVLFDKW